MGQTTPNIGIFIPAAGEKNYDQSFAAGMVNVDQHDHSGGPNKGLPIATEGLGAFSVTFDKLNVNVVDPTTGVGTSGVFPNQIVMLDPLKSIFQLAPASGFITMDGTVAHVRTFQNSSTVTWTNPDGVAGNPSAAFNIAGISPVTVPDGGTGKTSFAAWDVVCGGATTTGPLQQVSGEGALNQYLGSNGAGALPSWKTLPASPTQNFQIATLTLTADQFKAITSSSASNVTLVPAPGAGKVVLVDSIWGKLTYAGVDAFHGGSSVRLYWGNTATEVGFVFTTTPFKDTYTGYYYADDTQSSSSTGITAATMENIAITIGINSAVFTGGAGNTVSFSCQYSIMQI